jgi:hypothetical protein
MEAAGSALVRVLETTGAFLWDSLYGLIFGFLVSAIAQTTLGRGAMERFLGPNLRGIASGALFGIVASACSYGAAAAARGFYRKGADARATFAFLISSTNMNVAILIMFWAMLGWKFAFAEFFGGIIIIAVVCAGLSLALRGDRALRGGADPGEGAMGPRVTECLPCGMEGDEEHAVTYEGRTYLFCGARHEAGFRADPECVLAAHRSEAEAPPLGLAALRHSAAWTAVLDTLLADVEMLRGELVIGFVVAGAAAALVPPAWLSAALHGIGGVPVLGYPLLLLAGLGLAVVTFVCSMGNVPIARFLALAGIPLGANTTFVYGDLLIPPLVAIYRRSFPPKLVRAFFGSFVVGALLAGAVMDLVLGGTGGEMPAMGSMSFSNRFTLIANVVAILALAAAALAARTFPRLFRRLGRLPGFHPK